MGAYIQAGICWRIKVNKREMERNKISYHELISELEKEICLVLYEIKEVESGYIFNLKDEVLEKGKLSEFLTEQYKLFNGYKEVTEKVFEKLNGLITAEEIIELAKQKRFEYFQYSSIVDNVYCGIWKHRMTVEFEMITFFLAGKIIMEAYRDFLKYMEILIKKENPYEISKAVKVFIG